MAKCKRTKHIFNKKEEYMSLIPVKITQFCLNEALKKLVYPRFHSTNV